MVDVLYLGILMNLYQAFSAWTVRLIFFTLLMAHQSKTDNLDKYGKRWTLEADRTVLANCVTSSTYLTSLNLYSKILKGTGFRKMCYIYSMEYYYNIEKDELMLFVATWTNLQIVILSEVSQTERDKYHLMLLICEILKKKNLFMKQKQSHILRQWTYDYQEGMEGGRQS